MPSKTINGEHSGALTAKYMDLSTVRTQTAEQILAAILASPISRRSQQNVASVVWWDLMDYIPRLTLVLHPLIAGYWEEEEQRKLDEKPEEPVNIEEVRETLISLGYYKKMIKRRVRIVYSDNTKNNEERAKRKAV